MGIIRDKAVKGYIRLPKTVRRVTDPHVRNREKYIAAVKRRSEKGKQFIRGKLVETLGGRRRKGGGRRR